MTKGGARIGAGRPKGSISRRTQEVIQAIEASGLTPLQYMISVMQNENADAAVRLDAAKSAAPYVHARLASIEVTKPTEDLPSEADLLVRIRAIVDANPALAASLDGLMRPPH